MNTWHSATPSRCPQPQAQSNLGLIVGLSVGLTGAAAAIGVGAVCFYRRRKRSHARALAVSEPSFSLENEVVQHQSLTNDDNDQGDKVTPKNEGSKGNVQIHLDTSSSSPFEFLQDGK
jgi:hypothetical protein